MKSNIKYSVVVFLFSLTLIGCRNWGERGNGNVVNETREIESFSSLEISGAFEVRVRLGESTSLEIYAEENLMDDIITKNRGSKLIIEPRKNIRPREEIKIYVTTENLDDLDASGASSIYIEEIDSREFNVDFSGAGTLGLDGKAEVFNIDISGACTLKARDFKCEDVRIESSGASNADVYASKYLKAGVSGVGSIDYYGDPEKVKTDISGVGSIDRK